MNVTLPSPSISLVIPAYNEAVLLPRLLDSIEIARQVFAESGGSIEVIVADNCSTDDTPTLAAERGCQIVSVEQRCIAAVRNAGAEVAGGSILAFVDADAVIHKETFVQIAQILAHGSGVIGGATGVRLERLSSGIAFTYALHWPFLWLTKMDTGVVFCRREDFAEVGGYDERQKFGEDVSFLLALRKLGKQRRQCLRRATSVKAVASTRKFDEYGEWYYFGLLWRVGRHMLLKRGDGEEIADRYWYKPRR